MSSVICIGECMVELKPVDGRLLERAFAGDVFNTAVYLKRCVGEREVAFLSVIGDDALSDELEQAVFKAQLGAGLLFREPGRLPGLYLIRVMGGDRHFSYWRSDSPAKLWYRYLRMHGLEALKRAELVYLSGISLAILSPEERRGAIELLQELRVPVAYDPNVRPSLWPSLDEARHHFEQMANFAQILLPSRQDLDTLYGVAHGSAHLRRCADLGAPEIALTCDALGCLLWRDGGEQALLQSPVTVADTSGAGDAFNGAYLAARLRGQNPDLAGREGLRLASCVVQHCGALIPAELMPTRSFATA